MMDDRVIVEVEFLVLKHEKDDVYVARITELGCLDTERRTKKPLLVASGSLTGSSIPTARPCLKAFFENRAVVLGKGCSVRTTVYTSAAPTITLDMGAVEVAKNPKV